MAVKTGNAECPVKHRNYGTGVFEVCPHCGEIDKHVGLVEKPRPKPKPKKKGRFRR